MPRAPFSLSSLPYVDRVRSAIAQRFDGWWNAATGVGGQNGRGMMSFGVLEGEYLGLQDVEALYNFDGIAARVVDSVPRHSLRQGFTVSTGDSDEETALLAALDDLGAVEMLRRAWTWGRLFGGGAIYIGADDGNAPDEPLDEASLRRVSWLSDVDRRDLYPVDYDNDPDSPRFGQPVTYQMNRMGGARAVTMLVHHTRLIRFEGVTPTRRRRLQLLGWGDSVLQRCYQELMQARGAFAASGDLVQQSSQGVLKMRGLMDMMASDNDDLVKRRLSLMDRSRSVARSILLDADGEDFGRVDAGSLSGVADIMDRMVNLLASVTDIPVTVLMGQAPAGLNATGDSDIRNWYDALQSEREATLRPRIHRIVRLLMLSREGPTGGAEPDGWRVVLPPLWQSTPAEEADLRAKQAQVDQVYLATQVLTPEEVALSRFRAEGYSTDTSIDLDVRKAMVEADRSAQAPEAVADAATRAAGRYEPRSDGEGRYGHIDFTPPKGAQEAAARALEVRAEKPASQRGMTAVGIARARDLANAKTLSPDTVRRMLAYFTRHEGDKKGATWDEQGAGWQAWHGWGGDAGYAWARKIVRQMDAADDEE